MSQNNQGGLFSRVRRTLGQLRSPADVRQDGRRIAAVLKLNIAPLMGRRDAAVDRAADSFGADIFSLPEEKRIAHYIRISRLLELAMNDCDAIISGLSSQDTITREKRLRAFLSMLRDMIVTIKASTVLENVILLEGSEVFRELSVEVTGKQLAESEQVLCGTEINLVNRLRDFFARTLPRLNRYREYARKNFSRVYADKYSVSYRSYFEVYGQEDF
ncbi:MAG: hypothetical protein E7044_03695 [Lentisphaerae bacterium]|nr:hypothetical protein [Lentisphaerota bacterium]